MNYYVTIVSQNEIIIHITKKDKERGYTYRIADEYLLLKRIFTFNFHPGDITKSKVTIQQD